MNNKLSAAVAIAIFTVGAHATTVTSSPPENQPTASSNSNHLRLTGYDYTQCASKTVGCYVQVKVDKYVANAFLSTGEIDIRKNSSSRSASIGRVSFTKGALFSSALRVWIVPGESLALHARLIDANGQDSPLVATASPLTVRAQSLPAVVGVGTTTPVPAVVQVPRPSTPVAVNAAEVATVAKLVKSEAAFRSAGLILSADMLHAYLTGSAYPKDRLDAALQASSGVTERALDAIKTKARSTVCNNSNLRNALNAGQFVFSAPYKMSNVVVPFIFEGELDLAGAVGVGALKIKGDIWAATYNHSVWVWIADEPFVMLDTYSFDFDDAYTLNSEWKTLYQWGVLAPWFGVYSAGEIRATELKGLTYPFTWETEVPRIKGWQLVGAC